MAKVLGIHNLELKPGKSGEAFEKFFWEEYSDGEIAGVTELLLKGDKGERDGKYLLIFEFDGPEDREKFFVREEQQSDEIKQALVLWNKLQQYVTSEWTDYVELSG